MGTWHDLRLVSDLLHELYALQEPAGVLRALGRYAVRLAPHDLAVPALTERPTGRVVIQGMPRAFEADYNRNAAEDLSRLAHLQPAHPGAVRLSDVVPGHHLRHSGIWNEVMRPNRIRHVMTTCLVEDAGRTGVLKMIRLDSSRDFSERERDLMALAAPHVRQAYANAEAMAALALEARRFEMVCDRLPGGILVVKEAGKVLYQNPLAERWCARYFGQSARRGPAATAGLPDPLRRLLRPFRPYSTFTGPDGGLLRVRAARVPGEDEAGHVLLLLDEDPPSPPAPARLTAREQEVLYWVGEGKTNPEIGLILGISARTIQTHLDHIFGKLGVVSRAQAVAEVLKRRSR
jgi:DNA-binding CsgD family transcriptional regulator